MVATVPTAVVARRRRSSCFLTCVVDIATNQCEFLVQVREAAGQAAWGDDGGNDGDVTTNVTTLALLDESGWAVGGRRQPL